MTIRVMVCDDQALVRAGFVEVLEAADDMAVTGGPPTGSRRWPSPGAPFPTSH